ncbi:tetratricopeptide repeat-containing sensor histidine kinase [Pedobacter sp. WC2501]|uniref:tetratricopeptide repeat-containing sensor histidine kinase n=1 Tax=Pedobacter sp. WC2501 TaxID=3461400 RepID=UPI004046144B
MKRLSTLFLLLLIGSCIKPSLNEESKKENPLYDKAFEYRESGRMDSAFSYFNQAKDLFLAQKDSVGAGKCLINMGIISTDKGDYFGGQELSINALQYLNEEKKEQSKYFRSNFNNLAIATFKLKDYARALRLYDDAIKFSDDSLDIRICLNNKAKVYQDMKDYKMSLEIYEAILTGAHKNQIEYARALSNLAKTKWLINSNYNAETEFLTALKIRQEEKDLWGLNASYAHLADYYTAKKPAIALAYAQKMYQVAKQLKSPADRLQALQKLITLSLSNKTKEYFETYQKLADSLETARNAAKNQFALIRYETEKNKADFLKAKAENIEKQKDILLRNIGIATLALCLIMGYFLYQRRQKNLRQEKEIEVKKTELKYVKKVHDGVANGLYRIMNKLDNQEALKDNPIINEIEELYEQSRDISYERPRLKNQPFNEKISEILKSFASENTRVILVGNSAPLWEKVSEQAKDEIEHILQELMVNMGKHSQASDVVIKFEQVQQKINIFYTDNGIGIAGKPQPKNGLTNTGTRIDAIGGTITFDTKVEKGLKIQISFPVS